LTFDLGLKVMGNKSSYFLELRLRSKFEQDLTSHLWKKRILPQQQQQEEQQVQSYSLTR